MSSLNRDLAFDRFIAIDWSGSKQKRYPGIAVAQCELGRRAPMLVPPPVKAPSPELVPPPQGTRLWTRSAVLDWLRVELSRGQRLLVGFDFAFALGGTGLTATELWADVEKRCKSDEDLLGSRYVEGDSRFWSKGKMPADWNGAMRPTEVACVTARLGNPQTPFQLIGPKQVGKGALAGMRLLHRLQGEVAEQVGIWPFDRDAGRDRRSVVCEIYPRLFIRRAGFGNAKLRTRDDLNHALNALASIGLARGEFDDHQCDALITAAGLRHLADDPALWAAGDSQPEGWIFGVPKAG